MISEHRVITQTHLERMAKRSRKVLHVPLLELLEELSNLGASRAVRLWVVLRFLDMVNKEEWLKLETNLLHAAGLDVPELCRCVARIEQSGRIEVQRRAGKKPSIRLIRGAA
jgi:hypothetical protein